MSNCNQWPMGYTNTALIIGDLDTKVEDSIEGYESVIGSHGLGDRNENGGKQIKFCDSIML